MKKTNHTKGRDQLISDALKKQSKEGSPYAESRAESGSMRTWMAQGYIEPKTTKMDVVAEDNLLTPKFTQEKKVLKVNHSTGKVTGETQSNVISLWTRD